MNDDDKRQPEPRLPPARTRDAERFERQARALRENLRKRNRRRRESEITADEPER